MDVLSVGKVSHVVVCEFLAIENYTHGGYTFK